MDAARYTPSAFSFTGEKVGGIIEIEFCKSAFIVKAIKNTDRDATRNGNDASYFHRKLGTISSCSIPSFSVILFLQSESKLF